MKHKEKNEITSEDAVVLPAANYVATEGLKHGRNTNHASVLLWQTPFCRRQNT